MKIAEVKAFAVGAFVYVKLLTDQGLYGVGEASLSGCSRAVELCRRIAEYRPFFVEDPLRSENPGSFAVLRSHTDLACHYTSSPASSAAMLHLNMAVPNCAVQEHAPFAPWMEEVVPHHLRVEDGYLLCPEASGLGIDLDEQAAAAHPPGPDEPPHWRRPDGAVQDW